MKRTPSNRILFFGVLGGGSAWLLQFATSLFMSFFNCGMAGRVQLPLHLMQIVLGAAGIVVALGSSGVDARLFIQTVRYRETSLKVLRGYGGDPPLGRLHFLAVAGLVVNFLAITIMLMTAIGAPQLLTCQQS